MSRAPTFADTPQSRERRLDEYRRRRDFARSGEPRGGEGVPPDPAAAFPGWGNLPVGKRFCVHLHDARRLHFDLRLEHRSVLLSWAIPRGPTLDPARRRLAVRVEDHPVEYGDFEGVIPEGYGAGVVCLWDAGTRRWKDDDPAAVDAALQRGRLEFELEGVKLAGGFVLLRTGSTGGDRAQQWLLLKRRDAFVVPGMDPLALAWSVKTGRRFEEIAAAAPPPLRDRALARLRAARAGVEAGATTASGEGGTRGEDDTAVADAGAGDDSDTGGGGANADEDDLRRLLARAPPGPLPTGCTPMLATAVDRPFSAPGWLFELKYDGVRALATVRDGQVWVRGRRGRDETARFPELAALAGALRLRQALVDGEVVAFDSQGRSSFGLLQQRLNLEAAGDVAKAQRRLPVTLVVFDLLAADGRDLRSLPLVERKRALWLALQQGAVVRYAEHLEEEGEALFDAVSRQGGEGIVAKRADSPYLCGRRSRAWLKVKAWREQDCVICGWTAGRGGRGALGALVLGVYEEGRLVHAGQVGSGLDSATVAVLRRRLEPLRTPTSPLDPPPRTPTPATWVEPILACTVRFAGWTEAGTMRHPVFLRLRDDLDPHDCVRLPATAAGREAASGPSPSATSPASPGTEDPRLLVAPTTAAAPTGPAVGCHEGSAGGEGPGTVAADAAVAAVVAPPPEVAGALERLRGLGSGGLWEIGGRRLRLTNLDKPFWPDVGLSKRDLVAYVVRLAPLLLRHLRRRPVAVQVFPDGITGRHFWRKRLPPGSPEWVRTWAWTGREGDLDVVLVDEVATLAWLANRGAVDFHPWHSRIDAPDRPDWAVFDLDPADGASFADVVLVARLVKTALDHFGLRGVPKLSGQTGIQVYVPLRRGPGYAEVRAWVEEVSRAIGAVVADKVTWEWALARRSGRVRLDYTQNVLGKTLCVAYSPRPVPGAPISAPITWEELDDPWLRPDRWTMRDAVERVRRVGDLFAPVLSGDQDLPPLDAVAGSGSQGATGAGKR